MFLTKGSKNGYDETPSIDVRWNNNDGADKICKQLGYKEGVKGPRNAVSKGSGPIHIVSWARTEFKNDVIEKTYKKCTHGIDQAVICKGGFVWRDGSTFRNWVESPKQPDGDGGCVAKSGTAGQNGRWFDTDCNNEKRYACSMPACASKALRNMLKKNTCSKSPSNGASTDLARTLPAIDIFLNPSRKEEKENIIKTKKKIAGDYFMKSNMQTLYPELFKILRHSTLPCFEEENKREHMVVSCEIAGTKVNCSDYFTRVPTDTGMCCALNVENSLRESEYRELVNEMQGEGNKTKLPSRDGLRNGLKLTLDLHSNTVSFGTLDQQYNAFNLFIGRPAEFPTMRDKSIQLQPGREHFVDISATVVSTNGIRDIEPKDRRCLFTDEGHLDFYTSYTFSNCRLECMIKEVEKRYNCIPWQLPRVGTYPKRKRAPTFPGTNSTTCNPWLARDFMEEMRNHSSNCSHCLSDCDHVTYLPTMTSVEFR